MTGNCRTLAITEEGRKALLLEDMRRLGWEVVLWADGTPVYLGENHG